jgi:hypothetical protein
MVTACGRVAGDPSLPEFCTKIGKGSMGGHTPEMHCEHVLVYNPRRSHMTTCSRRFLGLLGSTFLCVLILPSPTTSQSNGTLDRLSLCEVLVKPEKYSGALICFRASVSTDGFEYTSLYDPKCNQGVGPWSSEETDTHADVKKFNDVLEAQTRGTRHQKIEATFTGRFSYEPQETNLVRRRRFEILKVDDLKVSGRTPK